VKAQRPVPLANGDGGFTVLSDINAVTKRFLDLLDDVGSTLRR
jgi:hypothetical protein